MDREETLRRYRHLRAINGRQQTDALNCVSKTAMLDCARRLGLTRGRTIVLDDPDEMSLVFDLVVHAGQGGRSRAIERYADKVRPAPGSDDALMLTAARNAKFAIWQVEGRHDVVGVDIRDSVSQEKLWLIDEALEASCPIGLVLVGRLMTVDDFVMTCGVAVPINEMVIIEAWKSMPRRTTASRAEILQDPRFATTMFRAAIRTGIMQGVEFRDAAEQDLLEAAPAG